MYSNDESSPKIRVPQTLVNILLVTGSPTVSLETRPAASTGSLGRIVAQKIRDLPHIGRHSLLAPDGPSGSGDLDVLGSTLFSNMIESSALGTSNAKPIMILGLPSIFCATRLVSGFVEVRSLGRRQEQTFDWLKLLD